MTDRHPLPPDEVAAYLEGRLNADDLARVEEHFADNPSARKELIGASRILASLPRGTVARPRWRLPSLALVAAAAVFAVSMNVRSNRLGLTSVTSTERRGAVDPANRVVLVAPPENGRVAAGGVSLSWHAVDGATYWLVVSDSSGNTLLQKTTTDTVVGVPDSIVSGKRTYYWSVDAQGPDGSSMTSGVRDFTVIQR